MLLLVLGHVEAVQADAEVHGELAGKLGLADARGPDEEEVGHGLVGRAEAGAAAFDGLDDGLDGAVLAEDVAFELGLEGGELVLLGHGHGALGDAGDLGDDRLDLPGADVEGGRLRCRRSAYDRRRAVGVSRTGTGGYGVIRGGHRVGAGLVGVYPRPGAGLVDHVDGLVRQPALGDVLGREPHGELEGLVRVAHLVVLLVLRAEPLQDLDGLALAGLDDVYLLEAPREGPVLLEELVVLVVGGAADAAQAARGEGRLEKVGGVQGAP